jgi:hypothetical protein
MSKALAGAQLRWSTIEKECFAMYHSLKVFADLLLGQPFILRTDHKNLLYLNAAGSSKVTRWKLEIQNYNFFIDHIPGVDNIPADAFSRLVKPHVSKVSALNVITEEEAVPVQPGSAEEHGAADIALRSALEVDLMDTEQGGVPVQPTYTEDRGAAIALHHGPMGHFGVSKILDSALLTFLCTGRRNRNMLKIYARSSSALEKKV